MAEGCCGAETEITTIRILTRRNWPPSWTQDTIPGDLLLLDGPTGKSGGILRIRAATAFLVLSPGQVWGKKLVLWPYPSDGITSFRIEGTRLRYFKSKK